MGGSATGGGVTVAGGGTGVCGTGVVEEILDGVDVPVSTEVEVVV